MDTTEVIKKFQTFPEDGNLDEAVQRASEAASEPVTLPTSYVMWLTLRSKFVDELAAKDSTILDRWKEFETWSLEELTRKYGGQ